MSARMEQVLAAKTVNNIYSDFPFLSIVATGKHTEIVLTRGVGLHTILGFSVDLAIGNFLDRCGKKMS